LLIPLSLQPVKKLVPLKQEGLYQRPIHVIRIEAAVKTGALRTIHIETA